MDSTTITKAIAGVGVMICAMLLAMTGKIDGAQAMAAVSAVGGIFIGGQALMGAAKSIGAGMSSKAQIINSTPTVPPTK